MWPWTKKEEPKSVYTPDLAILENRPQHLLFHYGDDLSHVPRECGAFTDEKMIMWTARTKVGAGPVALQLHVDRNIPRGRIGGFIYRVTTEDLIYLDTHMVNGVEFNRKRVKLRLPFDSQTRNLEYRHYTEQRAWMYLGVKAHWEPQIDWDTQFHRGNGTSEYVPARCHTAGSANYSDDQWVKRYFQFNRKRTEPVQMKSYLYFKGSRRSPLIEPPFEPTPADELRMHYNKEP